jgi:hypothetical protein
VIKLLQLGFFVSLLISCKHKKELADDHSNSLKFYTAKSIDSLVTIIDSNVSETLSKDDTTFTQFVVSEEKKLIRNFLFKDVSRMIYCVDKLRLYGLSIKKYYFKNDQLIKVSFSGIDGFSSRSLGSYYYSREKAFLITTSNRRLPRPDAALEEAKNYLKENKL